MTKKSFRDIKIAPTIEVACIGCGIKITKNEAKRRYWYIINESKNIYCCPNCDVTVIN